MKRFPLAMVLAFLAACTAEPQESTIINDDGIHAIVNFQVRAPGMTRGTQHTRDYPVGFEDDIQDITLFLAHNNGDGFRVDTMIIIDEWQAVSTTTQAFSVAMPLSTVPTKVFAVANWRSNTSSYGYNFLSQSDFEGIIGKEILEDDFIVAMSDSWSAISNDSSDLGYVSMNMAGSAVLPTVTKRDINLHIPLLRWVARADVNIDLGADSRPFTPVNLTYFHGYNNAAVWPGEAAYDLSNAARVLTPTLVDTGRMGDSPLTVKTLGTTKGLFATTYVGEHDEQTTMQGKLDAPCLILGGYFDGSPTLSYYRIDFDPQVDGHPFGQVLRNWQYSFNVTKIMSAGYATPEEAAANPAHSIVLEVEMWDENVQQINFVGTGDYMYVNTLDVPLNFNQSAQNTFVVRYTVPFDWGFNTTDVVDAAIDGAQADANFSVSITDRQVNTEYTDYTFTVVTLNENISNIRNEAGIFICAQEGAIISLQLTQKAEAVTERIINVLSLTDDIGTQGIYFENGTTNTGTYPMRTILTDPRWFGPTGVVKCGGFTFDRFQTGAMIATSQISLDRLQRMLDATDILVTNYASNPPQDVVDMILKWNRKPYHVLFVGADSGGTTTNNGGTPTNVLLRQSLNNDPFFNSGLTWYAGVDIAPVGTQTTRNNQILKDALGEDYLRQLAVEYNFDLQAAEPVSVASNSFVMATQTPENLAFMGAPDTFGLPDQGMISKEGNYQMWDGIWEFAVPSPTSPVTPLMVLQTNIFGYSSDACFVPKTHAMMVGVDVAHTTVYLGDMQQMVEYLTKAPPIGFTAGIGPYYNSVSVLMSNIWAWAVKNVLAQVKEE